MTSSSFFTSAAFAALAIGLTACTVAPTDGASSVDSAVVAPAPGDSRCFVGSPVSVVLEDVEAVRATLDRLIDEVAVPADQIRAVADNLAGYPKEKFPIALHFFPVETAASSISGAGHVEAIGRTWDWSFEFPVNATPGEDGVRSFHLPIAVYKDLDVGRADLEGSQELDLTIDCGDAEAKKTVRTRLPEDRLCSDLVDLSGDPNVIVDTSVCAGGCGSPRNVKAATVRWGTRTPYEFEAPAEDEVRESVRCECDDGVSFGLTCNAGNG